MDNIYDGNFENIPEGFDIVFAVCHNFFPDVYSEFRLGIANNEDKITLSS